MLALGVIVNHDVEQFRKLVDSALLHVDEVVVCVDSVCEPGIDGYRHSEVRYFQRALGGNFADQRNAVVDQVREDWVLFLDSDENLGDWLWDNLKSLISQKHELVMLPRANYVEGRSKSDSDFVGWPDWQPKLHRKHVRWCRPVHEVPVGYPESLKIQWFPEDTRHAILHRKTLVSWEKAHLFYESILHPHGAG